MTDIDRAVREHRVETLVLRQQAAARLALLTAAERRVAHAIARGWTTEQIARAHGRSKHTIANQLSAVFGKLGAGARADVVRAIACGGASATDVPAHLRAAVLVGCFELVAEHEHPDVREFRVVLRDGGPSAGVLAIAHRCALGQPNKVIAIELGIGTSTASESLVRFMQSVRIRDRAQLIRLMAPLIESATPLAGAA